MPWQIAAPILFVVLWSTGFIGAKYGLPYAEPLTFLLLRFSIASAILLVATFILGARWPANWVTTGHIAVAGLLIHGVYLGAVYVAIDLGVSAGLSALIVGTQPVLTAVIVGPLFGERVRPRQWLGFVLGVAGVALTVSGRLTLEGVAWQGFALCGLGLLGITAGTLYQKRFCAAMDLRSGTAVQYIATALLMLMLVPLFERGAVEWTGDFVFALAWLTVILSFGAVTLLYVLIRRGAAANVASLFYLVPPVTAAFAFVIFGERLGPVELAGMAVVALGVFLVNR